MLELVLADDSMLHGLGSDTLPRYLSWVVVCSVTYRLITQSCAFSAELNTGPIRLPRLEFAPAVGYSGAGFFVAQTMR